MAAERRVLTRRVLTRHTGVVRIAVDGFREGDFRKSRFPKASLERRAAAGAASVISHRFILTTIPHLRTAVATALTFLSGGAGGAWTRSRTRRLCAWRSRW